MRTANSKRIERNSLVEQEFRGAGVELRSFAAPAFLLPADEGRAHLFHDDNLAQQRHARLLARWCDVPLVSDRGDNLLPPANRR